MLDDHQLSWLKEFLNGLAVTDADRETVAEIHDTVKHLFVVLKIAKSIVNKPPAMYSPTSRKGQLQEAIKPFYKIPLKEFE